MSESSDNQSVLSALYPFTGQAAAAKPSDKDELARALIASVQAKAHDSITVKQAFFDCHSETLLSAAKLIAATYTQQRKLLTAGNGGSSCDAAHLAVEFMHPVTTGRKALPAINLTQDTAMMTAVSNDVGTDHVITRQLSALASPGDTLVVFSTSGNSANLIEACKKARAMELSVIAFTGRTGGELQRQQLTDVCITVPSDSIHRIQECHLACYHILWDLVHSLLANSRLSQEKK